MKFDKDRKFIRVALVLPTEYAYANGVLRGIIAATRERNLYTSPDAPKKGLRSLPWQFRVYRGIYGHSRKYLRRWFSDWNPDGIICQIYDDRLEEVYLESGKPVVELFESRAESPFPRILPDDIAAGELAAKHFLERGFRHFAFFGVPWMRWAREREQGFKSTIKKAFKERADASAAHRSSDSFTFASYGDNRSRNDGAFSGTYGEQAAAMASWIASLPKPLALFSANDLWGFELVQAAREVGRQVPDDVAVLGVDNEELLCELAHPPLSSIKLGGEPIGHAAVALLEDLMLGRKPPKKIAKVPPLEVVTRQSTDVLAVEDPDVAAALHHIRQFASEGLSVKELLEAVAVNRRTLERRFLSVLGHTPLEEIQRVRMERARILLRTALSIHEVAARSGFATSEYLATAFRRDSGLTPTEYRRQFSPTGRWDSLPPNLAR